MFLPIHGGETGNLTVGLTGTAVGGSYCLAGSYLLLVCSERSLMADSRGRTLRILGRSKKIDSGMV